jgi:arylsulfatase A-like enzyme
MRMQLLLGLLAACGGGEGPPAGLVQPQGVLPADQPWVFGGPGLALTEAPAAAPEAERPIVISDAHLSLESTEWTAARPDDVPAGAVLRASGRTRKAAPAIVVDHPVEKGVAIELQVGVRTAGLEPGPRAGGAAMVVEELDKDGERVDLHDGLQRLSGDTPWRTQSLRITPRSRTRALRIRLEPASGRATGEAAFRDLAVRAVPMEERIGPGLAGHHARAREAKLGRITRPALLTRAGEHWTADVPAAGGTLSLAWARPRRGAPGEVCASVFVADAETELGCLGDKDGGSWSEHTVVVAPGQGPQRVRIAVTGPPGAVALLGDPVVRSGAAVAPGKPDLALIVIDTLRADHLGMQGYAERPTSPNLDAFAGRALRYAQARSTSGWTATSLGTVVTGLMPSSHRAGSRRERAHEPDGLSLSSKKRHQLVFRGLRGDRPTVPELLRREGYRTRSWVDNTFFASPYGFARGFSVHDHYAGDELLGIAEGAGKALAFLDGLPPRAERAPYLLVVHAIDPHAPYQARVPAEPGFEVPESLRPEMEHVEARGQEAWVVEDIWKAGRVDNDGLLVPYDAEIRYMDAQLAPLIARLEADGAGVVLLSDHGEEFFEHKGYSHGRSLYEEVLRVPLVVRAPGDAPPVGVVDAPVSLDGVASTLLGFAGLGAPPGAAGPLPERTGQAPPRAFVSEGTYRGKDMTAVLAGKHKAVLVHPPGLRSAQLKSAAQAWARGEMSGDLAIYDLVADPGEQLDVSAGLEEGERAPVLDALFGHIARAEPGLHIRCEGAAPEVVVDADEPIARFVPFAWGADHRAAIDAARRRFRLTPADGAVAWGVLRHSAEPGELSIQVGGAAVAASVSSDPELPTALPGTACVAWQVRAEGANATLDADEVANLEALGYLGE